MQITKIKFKNGLTEIHYNVNRNSVDSNGFVVSHVDEYTIKSTEAPAPELESSLQNLASEVCDMLELPSTYEQGLTVTGVSFSYPNDIMGAVITASKKLVNSYSPFNLNTPFKPSQDYNGNDDMNDNLLDDETVRKLNKLLDEAEQYINGKRKQTTLFEESVA